ncbi:homoserine O-acetyltransferase [Dimargaris cristalligena]|nr:homoserine O-acetyltransferase [Dimargaris cristalligena]
MWRYLPVNPQGIVGQVRSTGWRCPPPVPLKLTRAIPGTALSLSPASLGHRRSFTGTPFGLFAAHPSREQSEARPRYPHNDPSWSNGAAPAPPDPPLRAFPCVDRIEERTRQLETATGTTHPHPLPRAPPGHRTFRYPSPFLCDYGGFLPEFQLAYETWGTLDAQASNAILIHTGLSANSHARSHADNENPGWWEKFIGPGLPIDTNKFFVICTNVLGGCYGSTGPASINPHTGQRYATRFPILSIHDMVRAQFLMLDHLGIQCLYASVGASMGGMQSLAACALFPHRVRRLITISACARSHPYSIALRHVQRQVLMSDPNWRKGYYYDPVGGGDATTSSSGGHAGPDGSGSGAVVPPHAGMKLARQIATISYRSGPEWEKRFGRKRLQPQQPPEFCADFMIESYLDHQGEKFCLEYDPNSLLYISKAMDLFDMSSSALQEIIQRRSRAWHQFARDRPELKFPTADSCREGEGAYPSIPRPSSDGTGEQGPLASPDHEWNHPVDSSQCSRGSSNPLSDEAGTDKREGTDSMMNDAYADDRNLVAGLRDIQIPTLVLGVKSDILFPVWQQQEIARSLRRAGNSRVTYYELDAFYGHDTFLIDLPNIGAAVKGHLENHIEGREE